LQLLQRIDLPQNLFIVFFIFPLIIITLTVGISHLSYRYFESYFLKLKDRFYTFKL